MSQNNPSWNVSVASDHNVIDAVSKEGIDVSLFNKNFFVALVDIYRLIQTRKYGGLWLDIKSACFANIDDAICGEDHLFMRWPKYVISGKEYNIGENDTLLGHGCNRGEVINWAFYATKDSPVIDRAIHIVKENIKMYDSSVFGTGKLGVINTTGPVPLTIAVKGAGLYDGIEIYSDMMFQYTIFGKDFAHKRLFGTRHYSKIDEPVIIRA